MQAGLPYFTHDRIRKIDTTKCPRDDWIDWMRDSGEVDLCLTPDMSEYITLSHLYQCSFDIVTMGRVIFQTMASLAQQSKSFFELVIAAPVKGF